MVWERGSRFAVGAVWLVSVLCVGGALGGCTDGQSAIQHCSGASCSMTDGAVTDVKSPGEACSYEVTTVMDGVEGSLRDAVRRANEEACSSVHIELPAGDYALDRCGADDDNQLGDLDLLLKVETSIVGLETGVTVRQTCNGERVIQGHGSGALSLSNIVVSGGRLAANASGDAEGGGVRVLHDLNLGRVIFQDNAATSGVDSGGVRGGAVFVGGDLRGMGATFRDNQAAGAGEHVTAEGGGAFVLGAVTLDSSTFLRNAAHAGTDAFARGGGLAQNSASRDPVTFGTTEFSGNTATGGDTAKDPAGGAAEGGGLAAFGPLTATSLYAAGNRATAGKVSDIRQAIGGVARGGGVYAASSASLYDCTFRSNAALGGDGSRACLSIGCTGGTGNGGVGGGSWTGGELLVRRGLYNANLSQWGRFAESGPLPGLVPATGTAFAAESSFDVQGAEFASNGALDDGAVVAAIQGETTGSLDGVNVHDNPGAGVIVKGHLAVKASKIAGNGVGISANSLELADGVVTGNRVGVQVCPADPSLPGFAASSIVRTTLRGNSDAPLTAYGKLAVIDSTVAENGGGIAFTTFTSIAGRAELELRNSTVTGNRVSFGESTVSAWTVVLEHSTIAGNIGADALLALELTAHRSVVAAPAGYEACPTGTPMTKTLASSYTYASDVTCNLVGTGDRQGPLDLRLGALADNGGPVPTLLPEAGSPLIDAIPTQDCPLEADARGIPRPQRAGCDVGAVEVK